MSVTTLAILIGFPAVSAALQLGQVTPFVALAISAVAALLAQGKPRSAAIAALGIAIEPHVAAAAFAALFIAEPQTRRALIAVCAVLVVVSLYALGLSANVEYVRDVLPAHSLANIYDAQQFSVAHVAAVFGVGPTTARLIGTSWYVAAAATGVAIAMCLKQRFGPQAIVLVPIAFEVFGGVYVHISQLAFAIPAFALVLPKHGRARGVAVCALFVAAVPWNMVVNYPMLVPAVAVLAIALCVSLQIERLALGLAAAAALLFAAFFTAGLLTFEPATGHAMAYHPFGNPFADQSWEHLEDSLAAHQTAASKHLSIAVKIPTLVAFAVLLTSLCAAGLKCYRRQVASPSVRSTFMVRSLITDSPAGGTGGASTTTPRSGSFGDA